LLKTVPATEILAHRFVWTCLFLVGLLTWQRRWGDVKANAQSPRALMFCLGSGVAVATNWLLFIWAVNIDHVIETSLGYFMTPLVNVLFGAIFFRERLSRLQFVAIALAAAGVLNLTIGYDHFPGIALALCTSFGFYGLLRKKSGTAAIPGLFFETLWLLPLAIGYLAFLRMHGAFAFGQAGMRLSILLVLSGIVTAVPLIWFGYAARHLRLTTVGFLQYLAPTGTFFLGVFAYHEPFTRAHLITFGLIWIALIIFSTEAIIRWRAMREREETMPVARPV
jgi:chloramphenicol-sensitive protein RarD